MPNTAYPVGKQHCIFGTVHFQHLRRGQAPQLRRARRIAAPAPSHPHLPRRSGGTSRGRRGSRRRPVTAGGGASTRGPRGPAGHLPPAWGRCSRPGGAPRLGAAGPRRFSGAPEPSDTTSADAGSVSGRDAASRRARAAHRPRDTPPRRGVAGRARLAGGGSPFSPRAHNPRPRPRPRSRWKRGEAHVGVCGRGPLHLGWQSSRGAYSMPMACRGHRWPDLLGGGGGVWPAPAVARG